MKSSLRRSLLLFCVFTLIMGLTAGNVAAAPEREGELIQEVVFEKTDLVVSEYEDYDVVTLARYASTGEIGKPSLPQASFLVVIPPGARVKRVEIISSESEILPGTYKIMPAQPPKAISSEKSSVILNNIDYHAITPSPGKLVQHAYTGSRGGYQVAGIFIYPLQYVPSEKSLRFYSSVKFKVIYQESALPVTPKTPTQIEVFGDMVEEMVINPGDVGKWIPPVQSASENNHDYFIITSSEFVDEFQPLADWKNKKGVRTEIATIEDISLNYSGANLQEKIKNFIIDMEAIYGAIYFLLGGDTNVVPHKLLTTEYILGPLDGEPIPSDLYYSDLNGDLYSDVFVGRAPAENEDEVITFVNKVLNYEKDPPLVDYHLEALMMAFWLDALSNAEDIKEECETHFPMPPLNVDEFYESQGETGRIPAINRINQGFGILNHADHTNYNAWGVGYESGGGFMTRSDISSLTNGDEQSVMYSIGCYSAAIEYDCCAERFLNNPGGGGVSYIGNSRYGWYIQGDATQLGGDLDEEFYISLFSRGLYNLGKAHADAKDQWVDDASGLFYGPYYKYTILELNLLGDPEMPIWTDNIGETNATHLGTIPLGASEFTVTVTENGGTPIEGALVCCMMDDFSVYEKAYTDASGEVTLAVSPVHDGTMWVTASKHNYLPYEGFATVAGGDTYTLTVNTEGNGSVELSPAGGSYPSGTVVTLTATADSGWTFDGWSGDLSGSTNPETITMDGNKTVTTTFTQDIYTLTVNTEGNGSVVKDPDQATYVYNTSVQLTANPDPSWSFSHWSGDLTGDTNPDSIIMTGDKTVTAYFTQDEYTLTVNTDGNGSVVKDPDQATYVYNTSVQLTANPDPGWSFSHWSGDLIGDTNPDSIIMTGDKTVTAHFTQDEYTLTVNTDGNGSVVKDPDQATYVYNTSVQLTANPDPGCSFSHWSGDLGGSTNPETITMDGNKTVTATFTQDTYTLTVNTEGNGSVALDPAGGSYSSGTVVNLTANGDPGWTFDSWSGDLTGSTNPDSIIMTGDKTVTAHFTQDEYTLTVNTEGNGSVELSPAGGSYSSGTVVNLTANADSGWTFDGWSGDLTGSTNPDSIIMTEDKTVTAHFTQDEYTLTVNTEGNGSVELSPAGGSYSSGTVVNLTANAEPGWTFDSWSGDLGGSINPETITMDSDKTVTATFTQDTYTLTVNTEGNGSVELSPAGGSYSSGTVVTLTAIADLGWTFDGWSGDLGGSDNPETITMDGDKTVTATFNQDTYTQDVANQDIPVLGTVSGNYIDTQSSNDNYESITEILSPGKSGKSYLEYKWTIDVTGGASVTFYVEAYHSPNSEGDDFEFSYSTDDQAYTYMLTVVKTENNGGYQTFSLPNSLSGTVYIRVTDTDQARGNTFLDTIHIDHMYIESSPSTDTTPPSQVTDLSTSVGDYGQVILTWTAPGDDDNTGIATEYDIRYVPQANGPIDTEGEWLGAALVTDEPAPSIAETLESMTVGALVPGASYYFAIKTADEVPNWSTLSNSPPGTAGSAGKVKDFANQDIPISGVVSGDYIYTHSSDDSYQSITEVKSRGKSKESYLEHKWTIDVTGGTMVTFYVEAYHSSNSEGDDFEFSYSTDDDTYIHMLTVEKTADTSTYQTFTLPSNLSGTVYICVTDKDRTIGNRSLDTIYIDYMYIESELL